MNIKALLTCSVIWFGVCVAHADHFPAVQNAMWKFDRVRTSGGWGASMVDSGTVTWTVVGILMTKSIPAQYRYQIEEKFELERRTYRPGFIGGEEEGEGYDSIFDPPRLTRDTLVLHGVEDNNGVWLEGDSCWMFVHDPDGIVPAGKCVLRHVRQSLGAKTYDAVEVDPAPCRSLTMTPYAGTQQEIDCTAPYYFTTIDNIGPAAFHTQSSQCLMDAFWREDWILTAYNVDGNLVRRHPAADQLRAIPAAYADNNAFYISLSRPQQVRIDAFLPSGRRIESLSTSTGMGAGNNTVALNRAAVGSAVVVFRIQGDGFTSTLKIGNVR